MVSKLENYREKLFEVAKETHKLIIQYESIFRERAESFLKRFERWRTAVVAAQEKALKSKKSKLVFHCTGEKPSKTPKDYVLYDIREDFYANESWPLNKYNAGKKPKEELLFYLGPELPPNPMDTLRLKDWPLHEVFDETDGKLYERDPQNREEDLLRKYFLLSVIHAFYSHGQPIIDRDCLATQLVYEAYNDEDERCVLEKQTLIETALFDIKTNLKKDDLSTKIPSDKKAKGTGQEEEEESRILSPIDLTKGTWNKCKNLERLRKIDSNPKRDGIPGTRKLLRDMKTYLNGPGHKRGDIADTLTYKNGRIVTSMSYGTMFLKK